MSRAADAPIPITAAGLTALRAELAEFKQRRPSMVDRVAMARSDGDLKENFAYHDARQDLGMLDGRIQTIEAMLPLAQVIEEAPGDGSIRLGSKVVVEDEFGKSKYELVGPSEVDISRGLISHHSPIGTALIGRRVGETVTFSTPGGERSTTVVAIV
jgi:transcription elongation factor GreA